MTTNSISTLIRKGHLRIAHDCLEKTSREDEDISLMEAVKRGAWAERLEGIMADLSELAQAIEDYENGRQ